MKRVKDLLWVLAFCAGIAFVATEVLGPNRRIEISAALATFALGFVWWRLRWRRRRRRHGPQRAPIPLAVRRHIYARDGYTCIYCGRRGKNLRLTIDHIMPVVLGGTNDIGNLVTACRACNLTKAAKFMNDGALRRYAADRHSWATRQRRQTCLARVSVTLVGAAVVALAVWAAIHHWI